MYSDVLVRFVDLFVALSGEHQPEEKKREIDWKWSQVQVQSEQDL